MTHTAANRLAGILREPARIGTASLPDWSQIIPEARQAGLLARLAYLVDASTGLAAIEPRPRVHLGSAQLLSGKRERDVRYELDQLTDLLGATLGAVVLLKGAAYLAADLPPARGRTFNDIDILVPSHALADVEAALGRGGWLTGDIDPYDERYYRRWMHQLPPLTNKATGSVIDVHHTIVPATARISLKAETLLANAMEIPGKPGLAILAAPDMVLHSAVHLFNEGEYDRGLRDLDDLNLLLRHFGGDSAFWTALIRRAAELDLTRPLFYALRYTIALLGTPVPPDVLSALPQYGPTGLRLRLMDALFERALRSPHANCRDAFTGTALWLLYARAHYLKMPPHLLIPHLTRKALRRVTHQPETL